jgi:hypothetical protein
MSALLRGLKSRHLGGVLLAKPGDAIDLLGNAHGGAGQLALLPLK